MRAKGKKSRKKQEKLKAPDGKKRSCCRIKQDDQGLFH